MLKDILLGNSNWEEINISISPSSKLFSDKEGNIIFQTENGNVVKFDSAKQLIPVLKLSSNKKLIGTGKDEFFVNDLDGTITKITSEKEKIITKGIPNIKSCIVINEEDIYLTQSINEKESKLWLINQKGNSQVISEEQFGGTNIAIYPNHKLLIRTEKNSNWIYNYVIDENGLIKNGQRFYWLHNTNNFSFAEMGEMTFDNKGNLYVASEMGIQVCDQNGRVRAILSLPSGKISSIAFGGKKHDKLYVISGSKIYVRNMNVKGVESWMAPFAPISQGSG
jgi:sugar lactone lactonase YvrE